MVWGVQNQTRLRSSSRGLRGWRVERVTNVSRKWSRSPEVVVQQVEWSFLMPFFVKATKQFVNTLVCQKCFFIKGPWHWAANFLARGDKMPNKFLALECAAHVVMKLGLLTQIPHKIRSHGFGVAQCARSTSHGLFHLQVAHSAAFQPTTLLAEASASTFEQKFVAESYYQVCRRHTQTKLGRESVAGSKREQAPRPLDSRA